MYDKAVAAWHRAMTLSGNDELAATLDRAYKESGYQGAVKAVSRKRLEQLGEKARRGGYVPAMDFVRLYVRLGDQEQAFAWLEKAYEERLRLIFDIKVINATIFRVKFISMLSKVRWSTLTRCARTVLLARTTFTM